MLADSEADVLADLRCAWCLLDQEADAKLLILTCTC